MSNYLTSATDRSPYLGTYQKDRTEDPKSESGWGLWCPKISSKLLYHDLGISEERRTLSFLAKYIIWTSCFKDLSKALGNIETLSNCWRSLHEFVVTKEEKSASTLQDVTDIEIETPKRKRITWHQAHILAFVSLRDAEGRRRHFAEEEAKRTAIWEELD